MSSINVVDVKVFEQYEYHDYLITIQDHYGGPELEAFAVPTKFAHLFHDIDDIYMSDTIFEENNIVYLQKCQGEECEDDEEYIYTLFEVDPNDTHVVLSQVKTQSSASILSYVINEINWRLGIKVNTVVLKQIKKKTITPKVSKNKRGFHQIAWASMVKLRDGKCTECGSVYDLHAHHIKSYKDYPELRHDVNNGVTLCGQCHRQWHKIHGR